MNEPVIDKIKEFVKFGEVKITLQDSRVVSAKYYVGDKENVITLEELNKNAS